MFAASQLEAVVRALPAEFTTAELVAAATVHLKIRRIDNVILRLVTADYIRLVDARPRRHLRNGKNLGGRPMHVYAKTRKGRRLGIGHVSGAAP